MEDVEARQLAKQNEEKMKQMVGIMAQAESQT